ncbi:F-box and associated interaction domains-containing protein [Striga asiatica]|uniref:F-box and associated interaction domains-containing protein n=1 Tax=Striga asiatica TaxID=4170 RepID=A0A5A7RDZ4_STRAF|nr:F-box and associated interaction domains-containing protein [Striga asiatica]
MPHYIRHRRLWKCETRPGGAEEAKISQGAGDLALNIDARFILEPITVKYLTSLSFPSQGCLEALDGTYDPVGVPHPRKDSKTLVKEIEPFLDFSHREVFPEIYNQYTAAVGEDIRPWSVISPFKTKVGLYKEVYKQVVDLFGPPIIVKKLILCGFLPKRAIILIFDDNIGLVK